MDIEPSRTPTLMDTDVSRDVTERAEQRERALLVSVAEAGEMLGQGRSTAFNMAKRGLLPTVKLAGRRMVSVKALEQMVDTMTAERNAKR